MPYIERESVRYVLAGGFNTVATYAAYVALVPFVGYGIAYSATYAAGICLAYYLSARFVFQRPLRWRHALKYPLVYVLQYGLGLALTTVLVEIANLNPNYAAAIAIVITVPFTFWLSRWIIKGPERPATAAHVPQPEGGASKPVAE
jgi:putative flippase GtrA